MKSKKTLSIIGIVLALFVITTVASCNSNPVEFTVRGHYFTDSPEDFPDGYYVFYLTSTPTEYSDYLNTSVFYPSGERTVSNMWNKNYKGVIEDALNEGLFHEFSLAYNGSVSYYLCLNTNPQE